MEIVQYPNPILKKETKKVESIDKNIKQIVEKMKRIMVKEGGIGLSANQIGIDLAIFIAKPKDKFYVFINPEIIETKGEEIKEEGCLSIKNKYGLVKRAKEVKIKYQTLSGKEKIMKAKGLLAHIIQHEYDHLKGILFIDKAIQIYEINSND
jgi:peptide deformylase